MKSRLFRIDLKDGIRGLVLSFLTAGGTTLLQILNTGAIPDKAGVKTAAIAGVAAGLSYVIKNFLTNSNDEMFKPEPPK